MIEKKNLSSNTFETRTTGKWILAGEHAVLRGCPALVFPLKSKTLMMQFEPQASGLELELGGAFGPEFRVLFWSLLEKACQLAGSSIQKISGRFYFDSDIPVGSGLGASAALSVAVTRWFCSEGLIPREGEFEFARSLENIFHGESSGVDVAVVLSGEGLHYEREACSRPLVPKWTPHWGLTYTGQKGMTYDCVRRVKDLLQRDPQLGQELDLQMSQAVQLCEKSLLAEESEGLKGLIQGIQLARSCFETWDLVTPAAQALMEELQNSGALACKPTGSGGGGYVLSLWAQAWPAHLNPQIISCPV